MMMKVPETGNTAQGNRDEKICRKLSPELRPDLGADLSTWIYTDEAYLADGGWNARL